jgi:hypothetical protein
VGSGVPHVSFTDTSLYSNYDSYGYHPLNAKLAVPAPLPAIGSSSPASVQHDLMYGSAQQQQNGDIASVTNLLNGGSNANGKMIPVRLPNGMTMQVPSDELASMPNAIPMLNLPSAPFLSTNDQGASGQWRSKLAQVQNNIAAQQAQFSQYSNVASETMLNKQQESQQLQQRLSALQRSLVEAKNAAETQKDWLEQVARRNAALEVDKHKVQAEAQLAGITLEYQKVKAEDDRLKQQMLTVAASKEGLMKQAYAFRSVVRSDTKAIQKLMNGGSTSGASTTAGIATDAAVKKAMTEDDAKDKKAEASEKASVDKARLAYKNVEEAGAAEAKAEAEALEQMQSPAFEAGGDASGSAGASGPALL